MKSLGITISPSYVGEPECNGVAERFADAEGAVPLPAPLHVAGRGANDHQPVHRALQHPVADRAARASDARGRAGRRDGGLTMRRRDNAFPSGVGIDDRRPGHTLMSPTSVQETGCGTGETFWEITPAHVETGRRSSRPRGRGITYHSPVQTFSSRAVGNGGRGLRCALAAYASVLPKRFPVADGVDPDVTLELDDSVGGLDCPAAVSACAHWVAS